MAKKGNFQKLLMEKGEKIAVGVAGAVALLLIVMQLFMPGQGFFAPNPKEFEKKLTSATEQVSRRLSDPENKPAEGDPLFAKKIEKESLEKFAQEKVKDPTKYRVDELFAIATPADTSRRQPTVLPLKEAKGAFAHAQLRSYILNKEVTQIMVLEGAGGNAGENKGAGSFYSGSSSRPPGGGPGQPPGGPGQPPGGPGGGRGGPGDLGSGSNFQPPDTGGLAEGPAYKSKMLPIDKLGAEPNVKLAETIRPVRMVVVAASFPYRAQLDEFRTKLRLPSRSAVLGEASLEVDPNTNYTLPSFRFLGVRAQRMEVDADGKPLKGKTWEDVELREDYKKYIVLSGKRLEPEDPALEAISFDRLVMPRLLQMREGQYPPVEKDLPSLQASLEALKEKKVTAAAPSFLDPNDFDPFSRGRTSPGGFGGVGGPGDEMGGPGGLRPPGSGSATGPGGLRPPGSGSATGPGGLRPPGTGPGYPGSPYQLKEVQPPEHCLVRIVDVKIQPGKAYKYRLQVQMANPNFKRTDVASPKYSEGKELPASPWFELSQVVVVPPDIHYYAVDQKDADGRDYKGPNAEVAVRPNQIAFQIHRWVEKLDTASRRNIFVGEWVVGERVIAGRGEYVGRTVTTEVPIWVETREAFIIPKTKDKVTNREVSGLPVSYATSPYDAVLVDFAGGGLTYELTELRGDKPTKTPVRDTQRAEVLLCTGDGRLLALEGSTDAEDAERKKRLEEYRTRIKDVKAAKPAAGTMGPGSTGPFSP